MFHGENDAIFYVFNFFYNGFNVFWIDGYSSDLYQVGVSGFKEYCMILYAHQVTGD